MYPTHFFIIRQIIFFPTFFRFDSYNKLFLAGNIQSSKFCNFIKEIGSNSKSESNIQKT